MNSKIQLGSGLIGIGRTWGHMETPVPTAEEAQIFLKTAYDLGIRYFDTAPSYGLSEKRLGAFIQSLTPSEQKDITIATKFGEHWDMDSQKAYVDHTQKALIDSIDQSLERLGRIDILQVHKTTPDVLRSDDLKEAIAYAKSKGINIFGASVSDQESAEIVCSDNTFSFIQFPFNQANQSFANIITLAQQKGKTVVINRPFNMGALLYTEKALDNEQTERIDAYRFIITHLQNNGILLTGTKSPLHLRENVHAFNESLGR